MKTHRYVVVDLETTGNSPKRGDRIIQLSACLIEHGKIVEQYTSFLNPNKAIPIFIEELTGITQPMVDDAPNFEQIASKLISMLNDSVFVAHNVTFDLSFLQWELHAAGYKTFQGPILDTVELAKICFPTSNSYKLGDLSEKFNLLHERPHQADSDALATAKLLLLFKEKLISLRKTTLSKMYELSFGLKSNVSLLIDEVIERKGELESPLESHLEEFKGLILKKKRDIQQVALSIPDYPINEQEKIALLKKAYSSYDNRIDQLKMMDHVYDQFSQTESMVIEAGTGMGKTMGYLLPSAYYALEHNKRVIISTYTNQLQAQILYNEIPKLNNMLPFPIHVSILKGRTHYLDLFRFEQSLYENEKQFDVVLTKLQILVWLTETETGDVEELNLTSGGYLFWNRVKSSNYMINEKSNPWYSYDYYEHAKKQATKANIVITNHHMLVQSLSQEDSFFADCSHYVIDEAHHLEEVTQRFLGANLSYIGFKSSMNTLGTLDSQGLYSKLVHLLEKLGLHSIRESYELDMALSSCYGVIEDWFGFIGNNALYTSGKKQRIKKRLKEELMKKDRLEDFYAISSEVLKEMKYVHAELNQLIETVQRDDVRLIEKEIAFLEEVYNFLHKWTLDVQLFERLLRNNDQYIETVEGDTRSIPTSIELHEIPMGTENVVNQTLLSKGAVIFTSATLTIKGSFDFFLKNLGIGNNIKTVVFQSPYNYKENSRLIIAKDMPDVGKVKLSTYVESLVNHLIPLAETTKGRMLILFTSYEMLRLSYDLMKESGTLDDYVLMAQGITGGSKERLTKNFQKFEKAILFGTNTFWEGIDIPGEDLSCLVMVRLPFSPPDDPYIRAKSMELKKVGKNSFMELSLPEAVIRFKQGIGRLIRSQHDRGLIIIFDRRIIEARYGQEFLQSIPEIPMVEADVNEMISLSQQFL